MKTSFIFPLALLAAACQSQTEYNATGTFESTEIIVSAENSGKLFYLNAEEGMWFTSGTEVGLIDTVQPYLRKLQLEANMQSVNSQRPDIQKQIAAIQEQIATSRREQKRTQNLLKANAANQKELDDWSAQIAVLQSQLEAQTSSLENNTASLTAQGKSIAVQIAQAEDNLRKCHIITPIDGMILAKYAEPGEFVSAGKPLFKIADMKHLFLRAYVTSSQLADITLGDSVTVFADFGDDIKFEYEGKITWIADEAEFTPKTILTDDERANQVYAVKIAVLNDGKIKLGMYGEVRF